MKSHLQKTKTLLFVLISIFFITSLKSQCTFGNFPATYTAPGNFGANYLLGTKFNLPVTATLTGLGYKGNGTGSGMQMAIYSDNAGIAGTLVAVTNLTTNATGNITLNVTTPTVIPAGDYWIMANYQVTGLNQVCYTTSVTNVVCYISLPYGNAPPVSTSWTTYTGQDFNYWAVLAGTTPTVSINSSTNSICSGNTVSLTANGATNYTWSTSSTNTTITQSPTVTTTYSVIGTNTTGCFNTAVQTITVNSAIANAGPTKTVTCAGMATLTGSGLTTYTWTGPGIFSGSNTPNPIVYASGAYTLTGSNGGCASNTATVSVFTNTVTPSVSASSNPGTICKGQSATLTANATGGTTYSWSSGATTQTTVVTPTASAGYTVIAMNTVNSCTNQASTTIFVNPTPTLTVYSNSVSVCAGATGCLNVTGATTYTWVGPCGFFYTGSSPCFPFSPACACTFSVIGSNSFGCISNATVCTNISPSPTVTANSSSSLICTGQTATLTAGGATSYSWSTSSTNSVIAVSPTVNTTYTVTGTNSSGCTNSVSITQSVSGCIGLHELYSNQPETVIFPNPTTGIITITSANAMDEGWIEIYNSIGELIMRENIFSNTTVLNLNEQPAGIYFIKLAGPGSASNFRIIKQ
jgi:hypothetical protein